MPAVISKGLALCVSATRKVTFDINLNSYYRYEQVERFTTYDQEKYGKYMWRIYHKHQSIVVDQEEWQRVFRVITTEPIEETTNDTSNNNRSGVSNTAVKQEQSTAV